jgi:hypothetical protein
MKIVVAFLFVCFDVHVNTCTAGTKQQKMRIQQIFRKFQFQLTEALYIEGESKTIMKEWFLILLQYKVLQLIEEICEKIVARLKA